MKWSWNLSLGKLRKVDGDRKNYVLFQNQTVVPAANNIGLKCATILCLVKWPFDGGAYIIMPWIKQKIEKNHNL